MNLIQAIRRNDQRRCIEELRQIIPEINRKQAELRAMNQRLAAMRDRDQPDQEGES